MRHCLLLILFSVVATVLASSGDRASEFAYCVLSCSATQCNSDPDRIVEQPIALRLTRWTCADNCKYGCSHNITDSNIERGERIHQYYGKWPFWRLGGIQEPASVLFSLLNLWAHLQGGRNIRRQVSEHHPMRRYYLQWSWCSVNAWIWSSVFHTRDQPLTEKLDYFSAALAILYALYYTIIRVFHLYPSSNKLTSAQPTNRKRNALGAICVLTFVGHVSYLLSLPRFDYTYNMAFNLVVGFTHNILWIIYSLPSRLSLLRRFPARGRMYRPSFTTKAAILVILTTCAIGLEVFDFPPWERIIDAHALWHLATFPIAILWYLFLIQDSLDHEGWGEKAYNTVPLASRID